MPTHPNTSFNFSLPFLRDDYTMQIGHALLGRAGIEGNIKKEYSLPLCWHRVSDCAYVLVLSPSMRTRTQIDNVYYFTVK